ncbi:N-formylglutamate amidohydrolase [Nannocystis sp. ILAH1]|uniref:N-formylglutamate amidohydrolase n=1 Tax=unclassified Nannocystis TaxID=2627009 RepID=UPI00227071D7|nr:MULTISPECIES: N-formylglutamate amidohydrolase [unclassified Nannocystis]MCY0993733.1 N-formylglutamate amidohydrolase [Nannocystis sp. ILAH1]MCY1065903.1 N-formylglutamate amidohydrolase [Nannocystis sp. RBIL2]
MPTVFEDFVAVPGVCEVVYTPPRAGAPTLLVELPHGATRTADYEATRVRLTGTLPDNLEAFFYVNTDIGTPESAQWLGEALAAEGYGTLILRCLVPRTFIDCNRVVLGAPAGAVVDGLTPAFAAYIEEAADQALLAEMHASYHALTERAYRRLCGAGGLALQLHSYAPRSVGIDRIDGQIVTALRRAYEAAVYETWPERPAVDLICADGEGTMWSSPELVGAVRAAFAAINVDARENETYKLHPATMGYQYARAYPGQVLCVELNRGLLAEPFVPFGESPISPANVERMTRPLAVALSQALARQVR